MPRSALRDVEVGRLDQPQEDVLDVLADVPGLGQRRRVGDRERHVEDLGQRPRQQRLAGAGRAQQHDVALLELHVLALLRADALVVVVDGDGEDLLRLLLADDVLAELFVDDLRRRDALQWRLRLDASSTESSWMISRQSSTHSSQM